MLMLWIEILTCKNHDMAFLYFIFCITMIIFQSNFFSPIKGFYITQFKVSNDAFEFVNNEYLK